MDNKKARNKLHSFLGCSGQANQLHIADLFADRDKTTAWFQEANWPAEEPAKSLAKLDFVLSLQGRNEPSRILELLGYSCFKNESIKTEGWPFPIQSCIDIIRRGKVDVPQYNALFEAFVHFHFVTLASQFYWRCEQEKNVYDTEGIKDGLAVIYEALTSGTKGGGYLWLHWSGVLSKAFSALGDTNEDLLYSRGFADILHPKELEIGRPPKYNDWQVVNGGPVWRVLSFFVSKRNDFFHSPSPDSDNLAKIVRGLNVLRNLLGAIFASYRHLLVAMVEEWHLSDDEHRLGIRCCWEDTLLLDGQENPSAYDEISDKWWTRSLEEGGDGDDYQSNPPLAPSPPPGNYHWKDSLLLFSPEAPYKEFLYIMPLGFKYSYDNSEGERDHVLPGLIESVYWRKEQVRAFVQRNYHGDLRRIIRVTRSPDEPEKSESIHLQAKEFIEGLISSLERYGFSLPKESKSSHLKKVGAVYDLGHAKQALKLARKTVPRPREVDRILQKLFTCPSQRAFLLGVSGIGKTVLMSQIIDRLAGKAIYLSCDQRVRSLSSGEGGKSANLIQMHFLATLCLMAGEESPKELLLMEEVVGRIAGLLQSINEPGTEPVIVLVDGINQLQSPRDVALPWPDPLPKNVYLLFSSQPQQPVLDQVSMGQDDWLLMEPARLATEEVEPLLEYGWNPEGKKNHKLKLKPKDIESLTHSSEGSPVFLEFYGRRLRELYDADKDKFNRKKRRGQVAAWVSADFPEVLASSFDNCLEQTISASNEPGKIIALQSFKIFSLVTEPLSSWETLEALGRIREIVGLRYRLAESDLEPILYRFGGFLHVFRDRGTLYWRLAHERVGRWFLARYVHGEQEKELRLTLGYLGVPQLTATATDEDVALWTQRTLRHTKEFDGLSPESQVALLDTLLSHLPVGCEESAKLLGKLMFILLHVTGDTLRANSFMGKLKENIAAEKVADPIRVELLYCQGDLYRKMQEPELALQAYIESRDIVRGLRHSDSSGKHLGLYAVTLIKLGEISQVKNGVGSEAAKDYFLEALQCREKLVSESYDPGKEWSLCDPLHFLGHWYCANADFENAMKVYSRSLKIREKFFIQDPSLTRHRFYAYALQAVGNIHLLKKNYAQADEFLQKALDIREQLFEEHPTMKQQRDIGLSLHKMAVLSLAQDEFEEAEDYFAEALNIWDALTEKASTAEFKRLQAVSLNGLGETVLKQGRPAEAEQLFLQSHAMYEKMFEKSKVVAVKELLGMSFYNLALVTHGLGEKIQSAKYIEQSLKTRGEVVRETTSLHYKKNFMDTCKLAQNILSKEEMAAWQGEFEECCAILPFQNLKTNLCDLTWDTGF